MLLCKPGRVVRVQSVVFTRCRLVVLSFFLSSFTARNSTLDPCLLQGGGMDQDSPPVRSLHETKRLGFLLEQRQLLAAQQTPITSSWSPCGGWLRLVWAFPILLTVWPPAWLPREWLPDAG